MASVRTVVIARSGGASVVGTGRSWSGLEDTSWGWLSRRPPGVIRTNRALAWNSGIVRASE